jgi:hypothetical protein
MISLLRVARLLRQESLSTVAAAVGSTKGWISEAETHGRHVGKTLQRRIEDYYGGVTSFAVLSKKFDGTALASSLIQQIGRPK